MRHRCPGSRRWESCPLGLGQWGFRGLCRRPLHRRPGCWAAWWRRPSELGRWETLGEVRRVVIAVSTGRVARDGVGVGGARCRCALGDLGAAIADDVHGSGAFGPRVGVVGEHDRTAGAAHGKGVGLQVRVEGGGAAAALRALDEVVSTSRDGTGEGNGVVGLGGLR